MYEYVVCGVRSYSVSSVADEAATGGPEHAHTWMGERRTLITPHEDAFVYSVYQRRGAPLAKGADQLIFICLPCDSTIVTGAGARGGVVIG